MEGNRYAARPDFALRKDEEVLFRLRALYEKCGYRKFKIGKFEEYDFYARNRSFLKCENILTFSDLSGKLMALKPDVTLSIVKNARDGGAPTEKVYYHENVYRVPSGQRDFSEIMQAGLECIGDIDLYATSEVISLAAKSLAAISDRRVLSLSHMGVLSGLLDEANLTDDDKARAMELIGTKSAHELRALCAARGVSGETADKLERLTALCGPFRETVGQAEALGLGEAAREALGELREVFETLCLMGEGERVNLDFSIANDMRYYNGIIFQGFVEGVPSAVLSGGRYDNLLRRLGKRAGAIGFAVYLGLLERFDAARDDYDADILLTYDAGADMKALISAVKLLSDQGSSVRVQRGADGDAKCRRTLKMTDRGLEIVE